MQLANFLVVEQMLLVADNVFNTYNYPNLLTAICNHTPVFIEKVSRPYFLKTRNVIVVAPNFSC